MFHENFFDLESLLDDPFDRPYPKSFNINNIFQVKNIRQILVIFKSSMESQSLNIIIRRKIPTVVHRGREELETVSNT